MSARPPLEAPPAAATTVADAASSLRPVDLPPLGDEPLVSVLMASFNYERFVGQAVDSVLRQTYRNLELVVCDDASEDGSREVVAAIATRDPRVRLLRSERNGGMAAATNAAFAASSGQVICLLDADDWFHPDKLALVVERFRSEARTGFVLHPLLAVDAAGREIQRIPLIPRFERGWIAERLIRRGGWFRDMPTSSLSFRRELADQVFPIPEEAFRRSADGFVFTLLPLLTEVAALAESLAMYRIHGSNDFSSLVRTPRSFRAEVTFIETQLAHVNRRWEERTGHPDLLRIDLHLKHRLGTLVLDLMAGRRAWSDYPGVLRALLADDVYLPTHKLRWLLLLGVGPLLPLRWRERWFGTMLGYGRLGSRVRGLVFGPTKRA